MDRSFSPQNSFRPSPVNLQHRSRGYRNYHYQKPYHSSSQQRMQFCSPHSSPIFPHGHNYSQSPNNYRHRNMFELPSPSAGSPIYHSSPKARSPYQTSVNSSWSNSSFMSTSSNRDSSSYFGDISGSPNSLSSPFHEKNKRFSSNDSNPGHSSNIEDYIHPSMMEDPWKNDMIEYSKRKNVSGGH